jgi:8-oxo-dGTP diphosphatase
LKRSARAILVHGGNVALIERKRNGDHFFVFPGGSVEPGEDSAQAVTREVAEEIGLVIVPTRIVAEVTFPDRVQSFWLADIVGGEIGFGTGLVMTDQIHERDGTYQPIWMPIADIPRNPVLPSGIAAVLLRHRESGWPSDVLRFTDDAMWWRQR